jgi:hypothetical protein
MSELHDYKELVFKLGQWLMSNYWKPLYDTLKANPRLLKTFPGFLLKPEKLIYYMGRDHIGIEYTGPERLSSFPEEYISTAQVFDYSLVQ